jgi:hypothetical protein
VTAVLRSIPKEAFIDSSRSFMIVANSVLWRPIKLILFESSVLFVFWYQSPNVLDTPRIHAMKAFIDADQADLQSYLTSALDGYELSASCPGRLTPGESSTFPKNTRLDGPYSRLVGVDVKEEGKISSPCRVLKPPSPSPYS